MLGKVIVLTSHILENDFANRAETLNGTLPLLVHEARRMNVPDLSALVAQSMAQILLFSVEEKILIESACRVEQIGANQHAGAKYGLDLTGGQVIPARQVGLRCPPAVGKAKGQCAVLEKFVIERWQRSSAVK
jgi:hypothetical protein